MKPTLRAAAASLALLTATCAVWGAAPALAAPEDAAFAATTLNISAHGEAKAVPDTASIVIGVDTQGATAAEALHANAEKAAAMIAALKRGGIDARDVQTSGLNLNPQYVYAQNQPPKLTGYQATNQVTVTVKDLARLGAVVDAVVDAGATNVSQITFGLSNPTSAENTARFAAVKDMQDKAAIYATATGYHIVRLVSLTEGGGYVPQPRPLMNYRVAAAAAPATPVEAGEMTVRIDVTATFELAH